MYLYQKVFFCFCFGRDATRPISSYSHWMAGRGSWVIPVGFPRNKYQISTHFSSRIFSEQISDFPQFIHRIYIPISTAQSLSPVPMALLLLFFSQISLFKKSKFRKNMAPIHSLNSTYTVFQCKKTALKKGSKKQFFFPFMMDQVFNQQRVKFKGKRMKTFTKSNFHPLPPPSFLVDLIFNQLIPSSNTRMQE